MNCTLTGLAADLRLFVTELRAWKPEVFNATDFKITDGLSTSEKFKALTIRKTDELVGYGLANELAPKLAPSKARHLDAVEYHAAMQQKDSVVIDVRNAYESEAASLCYCGRTVVLLGSLLLRCTLVHVWCTVVT